MATPDDSSDSSTTRPLALRCRRDLHCQAHKYHGQTYWIVKEPVGLKYFRLPAAEYALLTMIDGRTSLDEICRRQEAAFAPRRVTAEQVQQFLGQMFRNGLLVADRPGQGWELARRRGELRRRRMLGMLTSPLAIRFRGLDPDRLLEVLLPWTGWFFSRLAIGLVLLLAAAALTLLGVEWDTFRLRLPAFQEFFGPENWLWLGTTLAVTKVLHEFGHGLSCKRLGGQCHEMGMLLLVLTPCLYCNVSDSWLLPNKWHRAAIGAAGMYVEIALASLATFLWWFSEAGLLNHLALQVMFVCSVSTLIFNGNPLLRYDGYYILSDVLEVPNLAQKANSALSRALAAVCLGLDVPEQGMFPQRRRWLFAAYTICSFLYRWVVTISILVFLWKVLEPYGLQAIGQILVGCVLATAVVRPLWKVGKFASRPGQSRRIKRSRAIGTSVAALFLVLFLVAVPLPQRVWCTFEVRARDAQSVYVEVPGRMEVIEVQPGESVAAGQPLARFSNLDLRMELARLVDRRTEQESQLADLSRRRFDNPQLGQQLAQVEETLAALSAEVEHKQSQLSRLELKSPQPGTVLPGARQVAKPTQPGALRSWEGLLTDPENIGTTVATGALFCQVGDPKRKEAVLIIDQTDIELVRTGQEVDLKLAAWPAATRHGQIIEIARRDLQEAPESLTSQAGGELSVRTDKSGVKHPLSAAYEAKVPLEDDRELLALGCRGRARIHVPPATLAARWWRWGLYTFHFRM